DLALERGVALQAALVAGHDVGLVACLDGLGDLVRVERAGGLALDFLHRAGDLDLLLDLLSTGRGRAGRSGDADLLAGAHVALACSPPRPRRWRSPRWPAPCRGSPTTLCRRSRRRADRCPWRRAGAGPPAAPRSPPSPRSPPCRARPPSWARAWAPRPSSPRP